MSTERQRSVVTGAVGFVGRHLVDALAARGDEVIATDVAPRAHRDDVTYLRTDVTDPKAVERACEGATTVFHNASLVHTRKAGAGRVWAVNRGGTENVIAACQKHSVKKLVYVSSASVVYEGNDIQDGDESMPHAVTQQAPYAESKIVAEKKVLAANGEGGLLTAAIRPHIIYGPHDGRFLPAIILRAKAGKLKFSVGRETKLSDFTYVSNLVDGLLLADQKLAPGSPAAGQAFFVTNGEPMAFWDFVGHVLKRLGYPPIRFAIPRQVAYAAAAMVEAARSLRGEEIIPEDGLTRFAIRYMCTHHWFSIQKARRVLGYEPKVNLLEGIDKTARWLESEGLA